MFHIQKSDLKSIELIICAFKSMYVQNEWRKNNNKKFIVRVLKKRYGSLMGVFRKYFFFSMDRKSDMDTNGYDVWYVCVCEGWMYICVYVVLRVILVKLDELLCLIKNSICPRQIWYSVIDIVCPRHMWNSIMNIYLKCGQLFWTKKINWTIRSVLGRANWSQAFNFVDEIFHCMKPSSNSWKNLFICNGRV